MSKGSMMDGFATVEEAVAELAAGKMIIVVDDEERENEGDFVFPAEKATPENINLLARQAGVPICVPMTAERLESLGIPMMVSENTAVYKTAFTVTVDLKLNGHTGSSAFDRAATIRALADPATLPHDLARPGHVFPLRAAEGGVLRRAGHTEAAVDLARLAGFSPVGVLAEIMDTEGQMARLPYLRELAAKFDLRILTIKELIAYRRQREKLVEQVAVATMPTEFGDFVCHAYVSKIDNQEYVAFVKGDLAGKKDVLVRVHSQCLTGDVFHSGRCDCGAQLNDALRKIEAEGLGVVLYIMGHEGRGIGLMHKIRAYGLQEQGRDTVDANVELGFAPDLRDYGIGAQVLADLGITSMRLMTNNPAKMTAVEGFGLSISGRVPLETRPTQQNIAYLRTKRDRLGHLLEGLDPGVEDTEASADASVDPNEGAEQK
ncbi:MAG: bifunctional 3,4-dihydroxy-2-butanone-4-phosphate synthase/GTP cyclohydrolase II [Actinomycetota bacterium]|nr:bifunctional 3,4-dihydroxy-2-butanone-4-phosphate synthase/GTP cyclohydrolase II [Actinomycetota bacterium]